jgi:hypothetical protein
MLFFRASTAVNVDLKPNVLESSSVSVIMTDFVNRCMPLISIPVCQVSVSSYWSIMQWQVGTSLYSHSSGYNHSLGLCCEKKNYFLSCLLHSVFYFYFRDVMCLNKLLLAIHPFTEFEPLLSVYILWK